MFGPWGPLRLDTRIWGHGLWKSLCTNSNHNPYLGHFVVTTPNYWTFKNINPTNSTNPTLDKYMRLLEFFSAKKRMHGTAKRGFFVFRIPSWSSCFHHVDMSRYPGQLRCLWPKPFMTLLQINLGTRDAITKDRNVDPPHLDLKIDGLRRLRSMNWWQYLDIYIYIFI